jgi:hypothetical protein
MTTIGIGRRTELDPKAREKSVMMMVVMVVVMVLDEIKQRLRPLRAGRIVGHQLRRGVRNRREKFGVGLWAGVEHRGYGGRLGAI